MQAYKMTSPVLPGLIQHWHSECGHTVWYSPNVFYLSFHLERHPRPVYKVKEKCGPVRRFVVQRATAISRKDDKGIAV